MADDDLFLIAHKVRGEAAFDVAIQMPMHDGVWWIIPTSGHRAYPYWSAPLDGLGQHSDIGFWPAPVIDEMPESLRDHYEVRAAPAQPRGKIASINLADLGL